MKPSVVIKRPFALVDHMINLCLPVTLEWFSVLVNFDIFKLSWNISLSITGSNLLLIHNKQFEPLNVEGFNNCLKISEFTRNCMVNTWERWFISQWCRLLSTLHCYCLVEIGFWILNFWILLNKLHFAFAVATSNRNLIFWERRVRDMPNWSRSWVRR